MGKKTKETTNQEDTHLHTYIDQESSKSNTAGKYKENNLKKKKKETKRERERENYKKKKKGNQKEKRIERESALSWVLNMVR